MDTNCNEIRIFISHSRRQSTMFYEDLWQPIDPSFAKVLAQEAVNWPRRGSWQQIEIEFPTAEERRIAALNGRYLMNCYC